MTLRLPQHIPDDVLDKLIAIYKEELNISMNRKEANDEAFFIANYILLLVEQGDICKIS